MFAARKLSYSRFGYPTVALIKTGDSGRCGGARSWVSGARDSDEDSGGGGFLLRWERGLEVENASYNVGVFGGRRREESRWRKKLEVVESNVNE